MIDALNGATLAFDDIENELVIVDQTLLPDKTELLRLTTPAQIYEAIKSLRVRGAPAIGVSAAAGFAVCARRMEAANKDEFFSGLTQMKAYLSDSRPTAQNLFWALDRMEDTAKKAKHLAIDEIKDILAIEAKKILNEDIAVCRRIGENGAVFFRDGCTVLTHCNAGRLAAVKYGTALAPIYVAAENGKKIKVYADETRPLLQGARLTAYELAQAGIDTTVICDNMAASLMAAGKIDLVITGADRIARNFDTANKIGTLGLAVLAKYYGIPFYIAAPRSTFDSKCETGADIIVEMRGGAEISGGMYSDTGQSLPDFSYNPAFDITPAELITAIISENGVILNESF